MDENYIFYIGILFIIIGISYALFIIKNEGNEEKDWFTNMDLVNSWTVALVFIVVGIIMLF